MSDVVPFTPRAVIVHDAPPAASSGDKFYFRLEHHAIGPKREYWVRRDLTSDQEWHCYPPLAAWTRNTVKRVLRDLERCLPATETESTVVASLRLRRGGRPGHGHLVILCVVRGPWRVTLNLYQFENDLPPEVRSAVQRLPHTDDSWTDKDERLRVEHLRRSASAREIAAVFEQLSPQLQRAYLDLARMEVRRAAEQLEETGCVSDEKKAGCDGE